MHRDDARIARRLAAAISLPLALLVAACAGPERAGAARFVRSIPWADRGQWLAVDTHTHSTFSDGRHDVAEVAHRARSFGCDVVAITDHGDWNLRGATPAYFEAVEQARAAEPDLLVLPGLEWNLPPYAENEHLTVLLPPVGDRPRLLAEFKARFDDLGREVHDPALADEALRWLGERFPDGETRPVLIYNHPGRRRPSPTDVVGDLVRLRGINDLIVGLSGAPGHQRSRALGQYRGPVALVDRWDPAVQPGGAWDQLLQRGLDLWAARAPSDFHSTRGGFWPCEFSETWLYAPERSETGVLRAFRAGSFFAAHGHIVRHVELRVAAAGLPRPALAGEAIAAAAGSTLRVSLQMDVPPRDWRGDPNRIDVVELIAVTAREARVVFSEPPRSAGPAFDVPVRLSHDGLVLRARGRRKIPDGPDLLFYTNPVRVLAE